MNGSEELLMPSAEYVMAFKWIIDGILLPAVGAVGIIGIHVLLNAHLSLYSCPTLSATLTLLGKSSTPLPNMLQESPF